MGTPIDGKPHTSPLVGDEKVPLSPDGFATTQEIADLGSGGGGSLTDAVILAPATSARNVIEGAGDVTELTLKAEAGQTAPLQEWKDENGATLATLSPLGALIQSPPTATGEWAYQLVTPELAADGTDVYRIYSTDAGRSLFNLDSGGGVEIVLCSVDSLWDIRTIVGNITADQSQIGLSVRVPTAHHGVVWLNATGGQTDPVLNIVDEMGFTVARVLPSGAIGISAGEPADGDINPGECFRWFDPTNGAARTCWKGKTLDGTVVSGSTPLT